MVVVISAPIRFLTAFSFGFALRVVIIPFTNHRLQESPVRSSTVPTKSKSTQG